jgi:hypothetical protein
LRLTGVYGGGGGGGGIITFDQVYHLLQKAVSPVLASYAIAPKFTQGLHKVTALRASSPLIIMFPPILRVPPMVVFPPILAFPLNLRFPMISSASVGFG